MNSVASPPPRLPGLLLGAWLCVLVLAAACTAGAMGWLVLGHATQPGPGARARIELPPPAELGLDGTVDELLARGVVQRPTALRALLRLLDAGPILRTSRTLVSPDQSLNELLSRLVDGYGSPTLQLTFPEGFTRFDFARKLDAFGIADGAEFLDMTARKGSLAHLQLPGDSAEGYLFPDTYELRSPSGAWRVYKRLVDTFRKRVGSRLRDEPAALQALERELGFDAHDVLILASIVEKEARLPRERATIAGVFLNRLRDPNFRPHRLQADPTVAYGCLVAPQAASSCAEFDGRRVTPAMVRDPDNPYNTYRHEGLPPGPICNPGLDSVRAVLHAEKHDYYYFVARGDGSHTFSSTLDEHNRAIHGGRDGG